MGIVHSKSFEIDLSDNGSSLYVFFGGISAGILLPPFEFYNFSKIIDEHKIFVRDFSQCWYQNGLPGISEDVYSTAEYLRKQIEQIQPDRICFAGNSMGGFAAILFASLIDDGEVVAFSPQTFISPVLRLRFLDYRWVRQICNTYRKSFTKRKVWDLKPLLLQVKKRRKISVFVSSVERLDNIHAARISGIPGVHVHKCSGGGHSVVKLLRDEGKLPAIMSGNYP